MIGKKQVNGYAQVFLHVYAQLTVLQDASCKTSSSLMASMDAAGVATRVRPSKKAVDIANNVDALRTHRDMLRNAKLAFQTSETVKGVKGPTQLVELPHIDLVDSFVVDNLPCIDLGVARNLGHLWFDSVNKLGILATRLT